MFEMRLKKTRICEEQNEILRIKIFVPSSVEYPKISGFYEDMAEKAMSSCSEKIGEMAKSSYKEDREKGVPFTRYFYFLSCDLLFENPHIVVIGLRAELKRGSEVIGEFSDTQWWELDSESMIPPKLALKEHAEWQKKFGKLKIKTPVSLEGRKIFAVLRGKRIHLGNFKEKSQ